MEEVMEMNMYDKIAKYIKFENNRLIFTGDEMVAYIPSFFFDGSTEYALFEGEYIKLLGIFNYSIFDKGKSVTGLGTFKVPTVMLTKPSKIEKEELTLLSTSKKQMYHLLKYYKGDMIIVDTRIPQDIGNVEMFFKLFTSGNLPNTIPYDDIQNLFLDNAKANGFSYPISNHILGIIIRELSKSQSDLQKPYALTKFNDTKTNYQPINIKDNPRYISPFTAFTSEDFNASIPLAIMNDKPIDAPLEKLLIESLYAGDYQTMVNTLIESLLIETYI
jgi:hypothetical protein